MIKYIFQESLLRSYANSSGNSMAIVPRARLSPVFHCTGALLLVASVLLPSVAFCEDLIQVFDLARKHDASILAAEAQFRAAAPRLARAKGALLPNINLVASSTNSHSEATTSGGSGDGTTNANTLSLSLRQPIFNVGVNTDVAIAKVNEESARFDYDIAIQDFILKVAQAYFDVLLAQDLLETKRLSKAAIYGQLDAAIRKFNAGLGIITDQEDARARYSLSEAEEIAAENDVRVSRLVLQRLTGNPGVSPKKGAAQSASSQILPGNLEEWLRQAGQHPTVLRAQLALDRSKLDTRRAWATGMPTVDLVGSMRNNRVNGKAGPLTSIPVGRSSASSIGVEVNIPLFSGFSQYNQINETVILQDQAKNNLDAIIRTAENATERAYFDLQSALARSKALTAAEASSRSSLEGTQRGYKAGLRANLDVLNAQSLLYQTSSDLDRVRYDVLIRSLRLKAAAGKLEPESLAEINRMLAAPPGASSVQ